MARSKDTSSASKSPKNGASNRPRFINVNLDKSDKQRLAEMYEQQVFGMDDIERLVDDGFRFAVSPDDRGGGCKASLSRVSDGQTEILMGRGASAATAIYALLYRHNVLLGGDWQLAYDEDEDNLFD